MNAGAQARELRNEALELVRSTGLLEAVERRFGTAAVVGSVDLDLMTWRDIDIYAPVERGGKAGFVELVTEIGALLEASGHCLFRAVLNDEWALPRGDYGSGYYWGLRIRTPSADQWKVDLWGWEPHAFAAKLDEHRELRRALEGCDRELILKLKGEVMKLPEFRRTITSRDVYEFVLSGRGTTLAELRGHLVSTNGAAPAASGPG